MSSAKKVWGTSENGLYEYITINDNEILEKALKLCRTSFCKDETVSICTEIASNQRAEDELIELSKVTARDGVSIAAVEKKTGNVVAVAFNKIQKLLEPNEKPFFDEFASNCQHESSKGLINFMLNVDSRIDLFQHYNITCLLENMFLMTDKNHRGKKLGEGAVRATIHLAETQARGEFIIPKYENIKIQAITAVGTSNVSQNLFRKLQFDSILEISNSEFVFKGKTYLELKPSQSKMILFGKKI